MAHDPSFQEERASRAIPASRYFIVWIALLVLTALTIIVGRVHLEHGWALVVALAIAITKGSLVALFFMHLYDHGGASRIVLATSLFFVLLLLGLSILDNASRFPLTNPPTDATMRYEPPGPDILSPMVGPQGTARSRQHGERGQPPEGER